MIDLKTNSSYNLRKLIDYIGDNEETIKEMVGIFLKSANELSGQMMEACVANDLESVSKAAHKLKPSLDIFGIDDLAIPIKQIEQSYKNNESCTSVFVIVRNLNNRLLFVMKQMRDDYSL
jgi:HPt (histidine-containing phosphotransfer) domain-containing protein